jgi:hypothetical protein
MTGIIRATRVLLQGTARVESEIIYQSLTVDEGVSFEGIARQRPNPLAEDFAVSPTPEGRQGIRIGEPNTTNNGTGVGCETAGPAEPLAAAETRRQLPAPTARAQPH